MNKLNRVFAIVSLLMSGAAAAQTRQAPAPEPMKHGDWSFMSAREVPVQSGGRVKPLDSFAREMMLFMTGSRSFDGWDPIDMLFSILTLPDSWQERPFIQVGREDVRRQLGLDEKRSRFSPKELMGNPVLGQYAMTAGSQDKQVSAPIANTAKADAREQEFRRVFDRLGLYNRLVSGEAWTVIPAEAQRQAHAKPGEPAVWGALAAHGAEGAPIRKEFIDMIRAYQSSEKERFDSAATRASAAIEAQIPNWSETASKRLSVEAVYNHWRPFLWAWIIYLVAALTWIVARAIGGSDSTKTANHKGRRWAAVALSLTGVASLAVISGIAMRCYVAGRPPVTNMYESIIWVSIGQMFFASILYAIHRQSVIMVVSCVLAVIGLVAADSAPAVMDPSLNPLVPVLRSNYWLTIHVLTITLGYAAFALTLGLGNVSLYQFLRSDRPGARVKIASTNQLTYRAMQFGVVLLAAGTILGGVWADYSWGRFWGWDPKEVWALIALLCYLVILHGRFAGWVGQFGFAAWSVLSFLSVMMAWYGVNFVLGAGLHSYGFASGGMGPMIGFIGAQLVWVLAVTMVYKRREAALRGNAGVGTSASGSGPAPQPVS